MKILKVYPKEDNKTRYNYNINYGVWDEIEGVEVCLQNFDKNLNNYDVILLPMYKRWKGHENLFDKIKSSNIKTVLFDNDSCYRTFNDNFYKDIDLILYRDLDRNHNKPNSKSMWHPWSVDTNLYSPVYGGSQITFSCTVNNHYPLRKDINKIIKNTTLKGDEYINFLQNSGGTIHTDNQIAPIVRCKALEIASCGTQIISNKTTNMDFYFPNELILFFENIEELKSLIENYKVDIDIQKELRNIIELKHSNYIRAKEILEQIECIM